MSLGELERPHADLAVNDDSLREIVLQINLNIIFQHFCEWWFVWTAYGFISFHMPTLTEQVWKASRGAGPEMGWATKLGGKNIKSTGEC